MSRLGIHHTPDSDRLKRVKKTRQVQLQRWIYLEKEHDKNLTNLENDKSNGKTRHIAFGDDIMLLEAVSRNDIKEVTELLEQGVDPNAATIDGLTVLHQCCIDGFHEMAECLIKYKADVNSVDSECWTPLHAAATCNDSQMCQLLSKYDSDFLALNADGNMPYDVCEGNTTLKVIELEMEKRGITQLQIDEARKTPEQEMLNDVKYLYRNKSNLDELDIQGAALIHIACSLGFNEVVQTLLEVGADYSLPDTDGWLPIHIAACWSHVDIVEFLVGFGASIEVKNYCGDTVFDLCDAEIRDRLFYIRDNMADIRKNYNINNLPQHKGFRRSRGSSVRRSSVRQKNMLSKKEAKEEFIALTHEISFRQDTLEHQDKEFRSDNTSTIEESSDAEVAETRDLDHCPANSHSHNAPNQSKVLVFIPRTKLHVDEDSQAPSDENNNRAPGATDQLEDKVGQSEPQSHASVAAAERHGESKEHRKRPPRKWCSLL